MVCSVQMAAVLADKARAVAAIEAGMHLLWDVSLEGLVHLSAALNTLTAKALAEGASPAAPALLRLVSSPYPGI